MRNGWLGDDPAVGTLQRRVASVAVQLADGSGRRTEPLGFGFPARFYVTSIPPGSRPLAVVSRDADGRILDRTGLGEEPPPTGDRALLPGDATTGDPTRPAAPVVAPPGDRVRR